jgi:hypothetical protein
MDKPMNLTSIPTESLIQELAGRKGIEKIAVGPYQNYRLETKYAPSGTKKFASDTVLIVNRSIL